MRTSVTSKFGTDKECIKVSSCTKFEVNLVVIHDALNKKRLNICHGYRWGKICHGYRWATYGVKLES